MLKPYHVRLSISQYGDHFRSELFTEDLGDTEGDLLPAKWAVLDEWMPYLAQGAVSLPPDAARKLGKELYQSILGKAENNRKWTEVLAQAKRQGRSLRLLIDAATDPVRDLPYGLLCEPNDDYYLLRPSKGRPPIQFVRILRRCTPRPLNLKAKPGPIRILLAAAEPRSDDVPPFEGARWLCELTKGLAKLPKAFEMSVCTPDGARPLGSVVSGPADRWQPRYFKPCCRATRDGLRAALTQGEFDILHLLGHGTGDGLLLCDRHGACAEVVAGELGEWCGQSRLQMAFLQVCSAARTEGRCFGGLAQQLLNPMYGNLAAVVASSYPLDAERSTPAALAFYEGLAEGKSPDEALKRGLAETNWTWAFLDLWARPAALGAGGDRGASQFPSPYRGLEPFEERDAEIFFGRDAEVAELLEDLAIEPVAVLAGDPGSGKTSLLHAGLAPRVRSDGLAGMMGWQIVSVRPGREPARNLMAALMEGDDDPDTSLTAYQDYLPPLRLLLHAAARGGRPLLILFDQFEEMFTLCEDDAQRVAVARALAEATCRPGGRFRLVLVLRGEYLGPAAALPGLADFLDRPRMLRLPGRKQLRAIVEGPAERHGFHFEGPRRGAPEHAKDLRDRILADPLLDPRAGDADAPARVAAPLPLLEFALERLWLRAVGRGENTFTHADYDEIGGLEGALALHAEGAYRSLADRPKCGPRAQKVAERVMTRLVGEKGTRRPMPLVELLSVARDRALVRRVIDYFVGEGILTIRHDPCDTSVVLVDLVHEVLIERWARLRTWVDEAHLVRLLVQPAYTDVVRLFVRRRAWWTRLCAWAACGWAVIMTTLAVWIFFSCHHMCDPLLAALGFGPPAAPHAHHGHPAASPPVAPAVPPSPPPPQLAAVGAEDNAPVKPLTDGSLHEAFLSPAKDRDPVHIDKGPPPPIVERPGVEAPSPNAQWIEGYWEWDPGRKDFVWVTWTWRVAPSGKFWVNGYWKRDDKGWYRVPGFWSDRKTDRIDFRKNGPPADHPAHDDQPQVTPPQNPQSQKDSPRDKPPPDKPSPEDPMPDQPTGTTSTGTTSTVNTGLSPTGSYPSQLDPGPPSVNSTPGNPGGPLPNWIDILWLFAYPHDRHPKPGPGGPLYPTEKPGLVRTPPTPPYDPPVRGTPPIRTPVPPHHTPATGHVPSSETSGPGGHTASATPPGGTPSFSGRPSGSAPYTAHRPIGGQFINQHPNGAQSVRTGPIGSITPRTVPAPATVPVQVAAPPAVPNTNPPYHPPVAPAIPIPRTTNRVLGGVQPGMPLQPGYTPLQPGQGSSYQRGFRTGPVGPMHSLGGMGGYGGMGGMHSGYGGMHGGYGGIGGQHGGYGGMHGGHGGMGGHGGGFR